jgi:hypothetical protein
MKRDKWPHCCGDFHEAHREDARYFSQIGNVALSRLSASSPAQSSSAFDGWHGDIKLPIATLQYFTLVMKALAPETL